MKPVNSDFENSFHRDSVEGVESVFKRMLKATGKTIGFSYAEAFDVSPNTIKTWRRRGKVALQYLEGFAKEHGVTLDYLLHGDAVQNEPIHAHAAKEKSAKYAEVDDSVNIRCLNVKGSAGPGNHVHEEQVVGHFQVSRAWVRNVLNCEPGKVDIIFVDGPSMEPTLEDGELVLVDRRCDRFNNDAVYAIQYDGKLRIKRVQLKLDGTVIVKSDNQNFEPDILTAEQAEDLRVIGKVLPWKFGKFKL